MMEYLRDFQKTLSGYDKPWQQFNRQAIDYFRDPEPASSIQRLKNLIEAIDMSFANLQGLLQRVENMINELNQDFPQGVSYKLSFCFQVVPYTPAPEIPRLIKIAPWPTPP